MKGVGFGKKGKLSPRYISPYQIMRKVRNVACELDLHASLGTIHPIFHVSMLKKYVGDPSFVIPMEGIGILNSSSFEKVLVEILDRQVRRLSTKDIAKVKVL